MHLLSAFFIFLIFFSSGFSTRNKSVGAILASQHRRSFYKIRTCVRNSDTTKTEKASKIISQLLAVTTAPLLFVRETLTLNIKIILRSWNLPKTVLRWSQADTLKTRDYISTRNKSVKQPPVNAKNEYTAITIIVNKIVNSPS